MTRAAALQVRLEQMEVFPGRPCRNALSIISRIDAARRDGIDLIVFPEMVIPGYLIADEWERDAFVRECVRCGEQVIAASTGIIAVFGNVGVDRTRKNEDGRVRKYNALFVAENGRAIGPEGTPYPYVIKTLLPNYREFDDSRHFFDLRKLALEESCVVADLVRPVEASKVRLGCVLCEDGWDVDYNVSPLGLLSRHSPDILINISASPYTASKNHKRNRVFSEQARALQHPLVYVNNVGIQNNGKTVFTFDGASCVYDCHGNSEAIDEPFADTALDVTVPLCPSRAFGTPLALQRDGTAELYRALSYGTREFMKLCGVERVVVGASGGIDSAVVAALYRQLLPPEQLLLVNMPSRYNSTTTIGLAHELASNLGCPCLDVPIEDSFELTLRQLEGAAVGSGKVKASPLHFSPLALENIQARDRSSRVLAAVASAFGGVFTCNANKSEATVGYTTLYGDLGGYLANIADLWKTEVYALARYLNEAVYGCDAIPQGSIDVVPSAELSAEQDVDAGKGDPLVYPYHDRLFRSWVEWWDRATPEENLAWYADGSLEEKIGYAGKVADIFPTPDAFIADLERWWRLYQGMGLAKRIQAPPVLAVKRRAFGFDHRESQMGARYTSPYEQLKASITQADKS